MKGGQFPFTKCPVPKSHTKTDDNYRGVDWAILKKNSVLPLLKAWHNMMATTPLFGFVTFSTSVLQEEGHLPKARTSDVFYLNAYKMMKRSSYDFNKPPLLGCIIEARPYRLNNTQNMIQKQGGRFVTQGIGLSYVPSQPVNISGRRKEEQSLVQYITTVRS